MRPKFEFGAHVRVLRNVRNDGTFPGREVGELLLRSGVTGHVRDVGSFLQDQIIYSVDFIKYGYRVGCREEELQSADDPWVENRYEFRDEVTLKKALAVNGKVVVESGATGEVAKVVRNGAEPIQYHVRVEGRVFLVPEQALGGESDLEKRVNESAAKSLEAGETTHATLPWQSK